MKKNKLIIGQLNIKLNISHMSTLINLLTIFHKTESKKELNIKLLRNKSFTHQAKNKLFKLKDNNHNKQLYNNLLLLAESWLHQLSNKSNKSNKSKLYSLYSQFNNNKSLKELYKHQYKLQLSDHKFQFIFKLEFSKDILIQLIRAMLMALIKFKTHLSLIQLLFLKPHRLLKNIWNKSYDHINEQIL